MVVLLIAFESFSFFSTKCIHGSEGLFLVQMNNKILSLNKNRDFNRLYSRGKSFVSPFLVVYVLRNKSGSVRMGITTSKKIGNAVQRNRARRIIRESFREVAPCVKNGFDLVFVARKKTVFVKSNTILDSMKKILDNCNVLFDNKK